MKTHKYQKRIQKHDHLRSQLSSYLPHGSATAKRISNKDIAAQNYRPSASHNKTLIKSGQANCVLIIAKHRMSIY